MSLTERKDSAYPAIALILETASAKSDLMVCSQMRTTFHPASVSCRVTIESRTWFRRSLLCQNSDLVAGA